MDYCDIHHDGGVRAEPGQCWVEKKALSCEAERDCLRRGNSPTCLQVKVTLRQEASPQHSSVCDPSGQKVQSRG
jgi:hypothetical protein